MLPIQCSQHRSGTPSLKPARGLVSARTATTTASNRRVSVTFYTRDFDNQKEYVKEDGFLLLPSLLLPKSRGYVSLRSSDLDDDPLIQPNFLSADDDLKVLLAGGKIATDLIAQSAFSDHIQEIYYPSNDSDDAMLDVLLNRLETIYHPVGTCKMGSDESAVVDHQIRVHGIEGLRVIDASIMPRIVAGNTNAPVYMIAEKGAAMILAG
jgi:choline dehydrogenase